MLAILTFTGALAASGERPHRVSPEGLSVSVLSNGCTKRSDFEPSVAVEGAIVRVTLKRLQPDRCRMRTHEIWLTYSWIELGLSGPRPMIVVKVP